MAPLRRKPAETLVGQLHFGNVDARHAGAAELEDQRLFVIEPAVAGDGRQARSASTVPGAVGRP